MRAPKFGYGFVVLFLLVVCGAVLVYSGMMQRIRRGEWGGAHIHMDVGEQSATIEYDCAHGEIAGPLTIDDEGKFKLRGTFTPEHGGPIRGGESGNSKTASSPV